MISLYVVLDMFVNMDEFTEHGRPIKQVALDIVSFYWPNVFLYFQQLSGVIVLFACMATIARMRRLHELTAILSSGVSLYRIAAPIIAFGLFTSALLVMNTELIIPSIAHLLSRKHDDVGDPRAREVLFMPDRDNALLSAAAFDANKGELHRMKVIFRDEHRRWTRILEADLATWEELDPVAKTGRWNLRRAKARRILLTNDGTLGPQSIIAEQTAKTYLSDLSPETIQLRQAEGWVRYLSFAQLDRLKEQGEIESSEIIRTKHGRIATPIISLVLLLLGLPFFLDREPGNLLSDAGKCMIACGLCFATTFISQSIQLPTLSALPFWIPIFIFATLAAVLIDRIRT